MGARASGRGVGVKPTPLSLIFYKNFITRAKEIQLLSHTFVVILSTQCKYYGMNLHANVKDIANGPKSNN